MDPVTFTPRDLNRSPAKVLAACDQFGAVQIRTREGRTYSLRRELQQDVIGPLPDFADRRAKLRELGLKALNREEQKRFDQWLSGDE